MLSLAEPARIAEIINSRGQKPEAGCQGVERYHVDPVNPVKYVTTKP